MRAKVLGLTILLACPSTPAAGDVGGQEIRLPTLDGDDIRSFDLAFSPTGEGLAVVAVDAGADWVIRTYRSADGGASWSLWDERSLTQSADPLPSIAVLSDDTDEILVIAYVDATSAPATIVVARTSIASTPSWSSTGIGSATTVQHIDLESRRPPVGDTRVYVTWLETDSVTYTVQFARSTDGGSTFETAYPLGSSTTSITAHDLVTDELGVLHFAVATADVVLDEAEVLYRRGANAGADLSDWEPAASLTVLDSVTVFGISVAASPSGSDALIAVHQLGLLEGAVGFLYSADNGMSWSTAGSVPDVSFPELVWNDAGPALGVNSSFDHALCRPSGGVGDPWDVEPMIGQCFSISAFAPAVALDPSRDDAVAMLAYTAPSGAGDAVFFDAEWRGMPGYGVPDACPYVEHTVSAPALADLEGDGGLDVVYTTLSPDDAVERYDGLTGQHIRQSYSVPLSRASAPAVFDLGANGLAEVLVGTDDGQVLVLDSDLALIPGWPVSTGAVGPTYVSAGVATSSNGDVVAATADQVTMFGPGGGVRAGFPSVAASGLGEVVGTVAIGDVDADGSVELVAAFENGVVVLDGMAATETLVYEGPPAVSGAVSLTDIDGDADLEIAIPLADGTATLVHHDGAVGPGWPFDTGTNTPISPIALTDSNANGTTELHIVAASGVVFVVDENGSTLPGWPRVMLPQVGLPEPIVQSVSTIGAQQILGNVDGVVSIWDVATGTDSDAWPRDVYTPISVAAASGDIDDDGQVELVVAGDELMWVLDMGVPALLENRAWPMGGRDAARSRCACTPVVVTVEDPAGQPTVPAHLLAVSPNPTGAGTSIRFDLRRGERARVAIYDVRGRLVRTLLDDGLAAGRHDVRWDGRDGLGAVVSPGVYFVRVEIDTEGGRIARTAKITFRGG